MSTQRREAIRSPAIPASLGVIDGAAGTGTDDITDAAITDARLVTPPDAPVDIRTSRVRSSHLGGLRPRSLIDVEFDRCDFSNARWGGVRARRVVLHDCRCTGLDLGGASLTDVLFERCVLDLACLIEGDLTRVWFEECRLGEADLDSAKLRGVAWRGCDLRGARLVRAALAETDLRGSRIDGLAVSPELVGGCTIEPGQADVFAAALGLEVLALGEDA